MVSFQRIFVFLLKIMDIALNNMSFSQCILVNYIFRTLLNNIYIRHIQATHK